MSKNILFLSALDFKEKSIQVIRKTPEAYIKTGWEVDYVVARDNSKYGNYFYEKEINPEGVYMQRFMMPLTWLRNSVRSHLLRTIFSKIAGYITVFMLATKGAKILRSKKIDVVYGYELHGVLALQLLQLMGKLKGIKTVSRFQGTWLGLYLKTNNKAKLWMNFDAVMAMKVRTDLCIMTNDGTEGDFVMKKLAPSNLHNFKFWINGVDEQKLDPQVYKELIDKYKPHNELILLSVCRLESWKRVDVSIKVFAMAIKKYGIKNMKYIIVGEGVEKSKLEQLAKDEGVDNDVIFIGGIPHIEVKKYLNLADIFISTYDLSNVGNPLLEAIMANKIIFTLSNGDTGRWIQHRNNGFIYDPADKNLCDKIAQGIEELTRDKTLKDKIIENIKKTEQQKLWSWEERMSAEVRETEKLLG